MADAAPIRPLSAGTQPVVAPYGSGRIIRESIEKEAQDSRQDTTPPDPRDTTGYLYLGPRDPYIRSTAISIAEDKSSAFWLFVSFYYSVFSIQYSGSAGRCHKRDHESRITVETRKCNVFA